MNFNKLLQMSQFHGGRRLAEKKCRWIWSISMLLLFGSAVTVITCMIMKFLENPTFFVQMETVPTFVEFPSVIVCPEVFFRDDKIDRFLGHNIKIPSSLNYTYLKGVMFMLAAFYSPDVIYKTRDLVNLEYLLEYNRMDLDVAGRLLTSSCESTLQRCRWEGKMVNCSSLFHMELTGDGFCCVFNGRSLKENKNDLSKRKRYEERFGLGTELMLVVNQSQTWLSDVDLSYKWLALKSSQHYVETSVNGTPISPGTELWMKYHVQNFQIDEEARTLSHSLRKCHMAYTPLEFFPIYHKRYCIVECEAALTLQRCNCMQLVHPRRKGVPYCNARKMLCARHARVSYESEACNCLHACDVATNVVQISSFDLRQDVQPIDTIYDNLNFSKVTVVRISLHNTEIRTNTRWSFYGSIELFAQLGGVFNMFFGCSILTVLELGILASRFFRPYRPTEKHPKIRKLTKNNIRLTLKNTKKKIRFSQDIQESLKF